jgi:hypothetical protein
MWLLFHVPSHLLWTKEQVKRDKQAVQTNKVGYIHSFCDVGGPIAWPACSLDFKNVNNN